jgi:hypothetical protein
LLLKEAETMPDIMLKSTDLEKTVMRTKQLASMALAIATAMYSRSSYYDAVQLLADLIGEHAEKLEKMFDVAWEKEKAEANTTPTTEEC